MHTAIDLKLCQSFVLPLFPSAEPTSPVQNLGVMGTGQTVRVTWNRPNLETLRGALTHYKIVYNRTKLAGIAHHMISNSVDVNVTLATKEDYSHDVANLSSGSEYVFSVEPCRRSTPSSSLVVVCGPLDSGTIQTGNKG